MMVTAERDRCWVTHRRRETWTRCPLCGAPITWVKLWDGTYSPCDTEPVLVVTDPGSKRQVVRRHELISGYAVYKPGGVNPVGQTATYARLPHCLSCRVLRGERRAWAISHRKEA